MSELLQKMFILENGVTGYFDSKNMLPEIDYKVFKQACYNAARALNGKVVRVDGAKDHTCINFKYIEMDLCGEKSFILINNHYPIISFSKKVTLNDEIDLCEVKELAEWFEENTDYIYPGIALLFNPPQDFITNLSEYEKEQIEYWNVNILGEVIFNFWDRNNRKVLGIQNHNYLLSS